MDREQKLAFAKKRLERFRKAKNGDGKDSNGVGSTDALGEELLSPHSSGDSLPEDKKEIASNSSFEGPPIVKRNPFGQAPPLVMTTGPVPLVNGGSTPFLEKSHSSSSNNITTSNPFTRDSTGIKKEPFLDSYLASNVNSSIHNNPASSSSSQLQSAKTDDQGNIGAFVDRIAVLEKQVTEKDQELKRISTQYSQLDSDLQSERGKSFQFKNDISRLEKDKDDSVKRKDQEILDLSSQMKLENQKNGELVDQIAKLNSQIAGKDREIALLSEKLDEAMNVTAQSNNELELSMQVTELRLENEHLKDDFAVSKASIQEYQTKLEQAISSSKEYQENLQKLTDERLSALSSFEEILEIKQLSSFDSALISLKQFLSERDEAAGSNFKQSLEFEKSKFSQKIGILEAQLAKSLETEQSLNDVVKSKDVAIQNLIEESNSLKQHIEAQTQASKEIAERLVQEKQELLDNLHNITGENEQLKQEMQILHLELSQLRDDQETSSSEKQLALDLELNSMKEKLNHLQQENIELSRLLQESDSKLKTVISNASESEELQLTLKQELASNQKALSEQVQQLNLEKTNLLKNVNSLEEQLRNSNDIWNSKMSEQLETLSQSQMEWEKEKKNCHIEIQRLQMANSQFENSLEESKTLVNMLQVDLQRTTQVLSDKTEELSKLKLEVSVSETPIINAEKRDKVLESYQKLRHQTLTEVSDIKSLLPLYQSSFNHFKVMLSELTSSYGRNLVDLAAELKSFGSDFEVSFDENSSVLTLVKTIQSSIRGQMDKLRSDKKILETQLKDEKKIRTSDSEKLESQIKKNVSLSEQIDSLKKDLVDKDFIVKKSEFLERDLQKKISMLDDSLKDLTFEKSQLESSLEFMKNTIEALESKIKDLEKDRESIFPLKGVSRADQSSQSIDVDLEDAIGKTGDVLAYIDDLCKEQIDLKGLTAETRAFINEILREKESSNKRLTEEIRLQAIRIQMLESSIVQKDGGKSLEISTQKIARVLDELSDISLKLEGLEFPEKHECVKRLKTLALGITKSDSLNDSAKSPLLSPVSPFEESLRSKYEQLKEISKSSETQAEVILAQKNLLEEYEAAYELFRETDKEVHVLRRAIQVFINGKNEIIQGQNVGDSSNRASDLMKLHLNELRTAWQHEVNANETLRNLIKDLRAKFVEKERKLTLDVTFLAKEIERLGKLAQRDDQSKVKVQYEEKFKLLEESLSAAQNQIKQKDVLHATERVASFRLYQLSVEKISRSFETSTSNVKKVLEVLYQRLLSTERQLKSFKKSKFQTNSIMSKELEEKSTLNYQLSRDLEFTKAELQSCSEFNSKLLEEKSRINKVCYELQSEIQILRESTLVVAPPTVEMGKDMEKEKLQSSLETLREELSSVKEEMENENKRLQLLVTTLNRQIDQLQRNESLINSSYEKEVSNLKDELLILHRKLEEEMKSKHSETEFSDARGVNQKNELIVYKSRLKKEMEQIYRKFQDQTSLLVREIKYLKSKVEREAGFRADLVYQKGYLISLLGGPSGCELAIHAALYSATASDPLYATETVNKNFAKKRFRKAVLVVLAAGRMRLFSSIWREIKGNRQK